MTMREVRGSTPGADSQNSGFHPFEVGIWVATITNSGWLLFEKLRISGTEGFKMVWVTLQNLLWPVMSAVITGKKNTLLPRWTAIINSGQSSTRTHTLPHCTHNSWWLVLGWVTTKENHPRLRIVYIHYIWRLIKFINSIQCWSLHI